MKRANGKPAAKAAYHHGNLRAALLQAGLALLEAGGGEPGLRELARGVGVSANAVYHHFADKQALLAALAAEGFRRLDAAHREAAAGGRDPRAALLAAGRAYIGFAQQHPALFRLMFGSLSRAHPDPELAQSSQASFHTLRDQVAAYLGLGAGDARVKAAAVHAWSVVHGLSHLLLDGQLKERGAELERMLQATLRLGIPALAARGGVRKAP